MKTINLIGIMKPQIYDEIKTSVDVYNHQIKIPQVTLGAIIECYDNPEDYAVDLAIPDQKADSLSYYRI